MTSSYQSGKDTFDLFVYLLDVSSPSTGPRPLYIRRGALPIVPGYRNPTAPNCHMIRSPDGHWICLGNWSSFQLYSVSTALLPINMAEAIEAVPIAFSLQLVPQINGLGKCLSKQSLWWRLHYRQQTPPFSATFIKSSSLTKLTF